MSTFSYSYWLNFLKCQKEIMSNKLKIYGISKKIDDNYRMMGEEVYLFSQKPKSHKSVLSQGRVQFLLGEINKDHEIIIETEKEIFELKEQMMEPSQETVEQSETQEENKQESTNVEEVVIEAENTVPEEKNDKK